VTGPNIDRRAATVDPQHLITVMIAAGWTHTGGRDGLYTRLAWPGCSTRSLLVPLDRGMADYEDIMGDVLTVLDNAAGRGPGGIAAQAVLDTVWPTQGPDTVDAVALVEQVRIARDEVGRLLTIGDTLRHRARVTDDGGLEVYQNSGATVMLPSGVWVRLPDTLDPLARYVVYGPHCHHAECAMSACDHTGQVEFGCREQTTCPDCGPNSPDWQRLASNAHRWLLDTYGTVNSDELRSVDTIPSNVVGIAELLEAKWPLKDR
jgi:hypothetical protein